MRRQLKILEYTLSSLIRRKAKNFSLIVVYAFTIATLGSVLFLTHALKEEATGSLTEAPALTVQRISAGRHDLIPTHYTTTIKHLPGVKSVTPRVWGYYYDSLIKANLTLIGSNNPPAELLLLDGNLPENPQECAIGKGVADAFGPAIGDNLVLEDNEQKSNRFKITGIFQAESSLLTNDLVILPETTLRTFFSMDPEMATDLVVEVYNPREIKTLAKKIKYLLPDTRPISRDEILHTYDTLFNWRSGMMLAVAIAALISFCILAWDKATGISATEKQEIGILKALGWETADVLTAKFWEGLVLSLTSFLLGILAAWIHVFVFAAPALVPLLKGWSVLFPKFQLTPAIDFYQLFVLAFLTIGPYLVCTIIPSWKTAVTDPEQIMRG
ncbi:ABC-type transport system, involved in lipoprotein release, permease component [Desulfuromusa kysingii]|uniref:ABC-type transport system, involved in lipoprotein release, permease component n=1 Tax=Desulfuromusa kysingii TaxID=37625 RepID=A0A1H3W4T5_9BACT|nr:ABC transporter permease [Desulfuromusa kysingii]SDZ82125.1 ABC-type transport system, involved in lipoprotein release, permease component [Desulfuromusa kysingii]